MNLSDPLARDAATALLAGNWTGEGMAERLMQVFGLPRRQRWMGTLVARLFARFGLHPPPPRHAVLTAFLASEPGFCRAIGRLRSQGQRQDSWGNLESASLSNVLCLPRPEMAPAPALPGTDKLPALVTSGELADWLGVSLEKLDWFTASHGRARRSASTKLRHYHYRWIPKSNGRQRLVECPKPRLKEMQRQVLREILQVIPAHRAAHAFRSRHSTLTCAEPHVGQRVVLRLDLRDFFPRIRSSRIHALFHSLGYPDSVARSLAALCTNVICRDDLPRLDSDSHRHELWETFGQPHLPQGAPTSPALANLCAYRLDCRLTGLARTAGASYTRYADDLIFSGGHELERNLSRFRIFVCAIVLTEGFSIRYRKTRSMRSGTQQSITGLIVNRRINVPRVEYDRLKAILHNCRRFGPESQNRVGHPNFREHLRGKIAYVRMTHRERGGKLQRLFDEIAWGPPDTLQASG